MAEFDVSLRLTIEATDKITDVTTAEEAVDDMIRLVEDRLRPLDAEVTDFEVVQVSESSDDSGVRNYYLDDLNWPNLDDDGD